MGGKPSSSAEEAPQFDPAAAEKLCKEAYAAGAFDASMHYQALLDSQWRFDAAATAGGCAATLLLSYMYFSTRMAQAVQHLEAERALVARLQHESGEMSAQWDRLVEANTRQLDLLQRHEAALRTARRRQAELRHVVAKLRRRGKCLACEVNALKSSIAQLRQHVTVVCCGG
ncbi:hypothetical protein DQ04_08431050, partial [Trypanosoma grayi]|uniref:hypothetical protein n=1 Tax=Trypanosoma grayi TaxID=71804 RepID=UPI0004F44D1B